VERLVKFSMDHEPIKQRISCGSRGGAVRSVASLSGRNIDRLRALLMLSSIMLLAVDAGRELQAEGRTANIVGLGAATCQQFSDDIRSNPSVRRDYLAWVQGFMSGVLLSRPRGIDESLDLNPATFGLINQLQFLEDHCTENASHDVSDAAEALYKRLRQEGKM
jgi:hypothetical protein